MITIGNFKINDIARILIGGLLPNMNNPKVNISPKDKKHLNMYDLHYMI